VKDHVANVPANQFVTIEEGKGVVASAPRASRTSKLHP
jgi:hypothetical protein